MILYRFRRPDRVTTIETRHGLLALATLGTLVWYVAAPTTIAMMALIMWGGLWLVAAAWAMALARQVSGERQLLSTAVQVGDEIEERVILRNDSGWPVLWAEFADRSSLPGYTVSSVRAVGAYSTLQWHVQAVCETRGVFQLSPWELRLSDPFGIFLVRHTYTHQHTVLVHPALAPLPQRWAPHTAAPGQHRLLHQALRADTLNAYGTRAYQPGDPLHHLHWPTTARRGAPYVKLFEPEAASHLWLIPDFDPRVHLGQGRTASEEIMVILIASLAHELIRQRLLVGLFTSGPIVLPRAGIPQAWDIVRAITPLHLGGPPLSVILTQARQVIPPRDSLLIVTPSLDTDWPATVTAWARPARIEAWLLDPTSFGGARSSSGVAAHLLRLGLAASVIGRDQVRPIPGAYGQLRRWDFMTLGTGRVVVRQAPRTAEPA